MRLTGRGYLLAALATAWAVAGCTTAGFSAGADKPSGSAGTSPATEAQSVSGVSVTRSPAASGGSVAPTSHGSAVPECTAEQLRITESDGAGAGDTASGHASLALRFTNAGPRACFLRGYPGVAVSGLGGVLNAQRAMRGYMGGDAGQSPSPVTVPHGGTASALLEWLFFPQDDSATVTTRNCPGYHAIRLLVTAPDQTTSTGFAAPGALTPVCWGFEVHPVVPGTTGRS
jgi:hypothetical protein